MAVLASPDVGIRGRALLKDPTDLQRVECGLSRPPTNVGSAIFATRPAQKKILQGKL